MPAKKKYFTEEERKQAIKRDKEKYRQTHKGKAKEYYQKNKKKNK